MGIEPNPIISIAAAINMLNKSMIKYFMCFLEQIFLMSCIIGYQSLTNRLRYCEITYIYINKNFISQLNLYL